MLKSRVKLRLSVSGAVEEKAEVEEIGSIDRLVSRRGGFVGCEAVLS